MRPDRRVLLVVALAGLPAVALPAGAAAQDRLVTVTGSSTVRFVADGDSATQRVPIRAAAGVNADTVRLRTSRARRAGIRDTSLIRAFTPVLVPDHGRPDAIELTIDLSAPLRPGTYDVTVRVARTRGRRMQLVPLRVVVPAARLVIREPVRIRRTLGFPSLPLVGGDDDPEYAGMPLVRERNGRSRVKELTVSAIRGPDDGPDTLTDDLVASAGPIAPSRGARLRIEGDVDVPVGTTAGTLELNAPELRDRTLVRYEMTTRRDKDTILWLILGGLVAGYLVRIVLGWLLRFLRVRRAAAGLKQQLASELRREPDEKLRAGLRTAEGELPAWWSREKTALEAVQRALEARQTAYNEFAGRIKAVEASLDAIVPIVNRTMGIPSVDAVLIEAAGAVREARALVYARDAGKAADAVRTATNLALQDVPRLLGEWTTRGSGAVQSLTSTPLGAPLASAGESVEQALDAVAGPSTATDAAGVGAMLDRGRTALTRLGQFMIEAAGVAEREAYRVDLALRTVGTAAALETAARVAAARAALTELRWTSCDEAMLRAIQTRWEQLEQVLQSAVAEHSSRDAASRATLVSAGRYAEAIPAAPAPATAAGAVELGDGTEEAPAQPSGDGAAPAPATGGTFHPPPAVAQDVGASSGSPRWDTPAGIPLASASLAFGVAHLVQFVVLAILFALVGYYLFEDGYVGTDRQMLNVFLWAFFTEVSIAALTALRTQVFPEPTGGAAGGATPGGAGEQPAAPAPAPAPGPAPAPQAGGTPPAPPTPEPVTPGGGPGGNGTPSPTPSPRA